MKTLKIALLLATWPMALALNAAQPASIALPSVPELGDTLRDLPKAQTLELANSGALAPSYSAEIDGIEYFIAVSKDSKVILIWTKSEKFKTPEGFAIGNTIGELLGKFPQGKRKENGWGSYVLLPSGWGAFEALDGNHNPESRILHFFKRDRDQVADMTIPK